jgi:hypothetical protein
MVKQLFWIPRVLFCETFLCKEIKFAAFLIHQKTAIKMARLCKNNAPIPVFKLIFEKMLRQAGYLPVLSPFLSSTDI